MSEQVTKIKQQEVNYTAELLNVHGVDYRLIGSRALSLYGIHHPSNGDIDIIVPRSDLRVIPNVRDKLREEFEHRVVLGTHPSMSTIDFVPGGISRLTHNKLVVPVENDTFDPVEIDKIKTLKPQTLAGLYGTIGGIRRSKDLPDKRALLDISDGVIDPAFDEFFVKRDEEYPFYTLSKKLGNLAIRAIPSKIKLTTQDIIERKVEMRYNA